MATNTFDLKLDTSSDIIVDGGNDLDTVDGAANLRQTIGIIARDVVRPLIGSQVTANTIERIESRLQSALLGSAKIDSVEEIAIEEVNRQTNTIAITMTVNFNNNFTVEVDV
jgi:hypothetical protein